MDVIIWVDDIRPAMYLSDLDDCKVEVCHNYDQAITVLDKVKSTWTDARAFLFLDHDLGEDKSGYDVAKYVVENEIPITAFYCHSMNPVGRDNINQLLTHYGYKEITEIL